jgi:hypothetical protein
MNRMYDSAETWLHVEMTLGVNPQELKYIVAHCRGITECRFRRYSDRQITDCHSVERPRCTTLSEPLLLR